MTKKKHFRAYIPSIVGGLILIIVVGFIVYFIVNFKPDPVKKERKIQAISLTKPPPPPPPPPKVEKLPEPEAEKLEETPEPEPEPETPDVADEAPPGDLGLDAEGTAGGDSFGLVGRKGGKGLLGGGGGGNGFAAYNRQIANDIQNILSEDEDIMYKEFTAIIKVWLDVDGSIKKIELVKGTSDTEIDKAINRDLRKIKKISEPPPSGYESPVELKITVNM
jgi:protein TonB